MNRRKAHQNSGFSNRETLPLSCSTNPFYAESGGQVGDSGTITGANGSLEGADCQKTATGVFIHSGKCSGTFSIGETVSHTSTHTVVDKLCDTSLAHLFLAHKSIGKRRSPKPEATSTNTECASTSRFPCDQARRNSTH